MKTITNLLKPYIYTVKKDGNIYQYIPFTRAVEQAEIYASQRESKYRELYEAREEMHKLRNYLFPLNEPFEDYLDGKRKNRVIELRQKISALESELNLNTK